MKTDLEKAGETGSEFGRKWQMIERDGDKLSSGQKRICDDTPTMMTPPQVYII